MKQQVRDDAKRDAAKGVSKETIEAPSELIENPERALLGALRKSKTRSHREHNASRNHVYEQPGRVGSASVETRPPSAHEACATPLPGLS